MKTVELSNKEVRMLLSMERDYFKFPIGVPDGTYRADMGCVEGNKVYYEFVYGISGNGMCADLSKVYYPPYQKNDVITVKDWGNLVQLKVVSCSPDEDSMGNWNWITKVEVLDDEI